MGFRYRKTKTFKNGVKATAGKKSAGVSFGGRRAGVSINSRAGVHVRASAPGTGFSYSGKVGRKRGRRKTGSPSRFASILTAVLFMVLVSWAVPVLIPVFILAVVALFVWAFRSAKREQEAAGQPDDGAAAAAPEPREIEVSCPCSEKFRVIVNEPGVAVFTCPKCRRQLRVDTSGGDL